MPQASGVVPIEGVPTPEATPDSDAAAADVTDELFKQVGQDLDAVREELSTMMQEDFEAMKGPNGFFDSRARGSVEELKREQRLAELRSRERGLMAKLREMFWLAHGAPANL
jgi:hypothetical protein